MFKLNVFRFKFKFLFRLKDAGINRRVTCSVIGTATLIVCLALLFASSSNAKLFDDDQFVSARRALLKTIEQDVIETSIYLNKDKLEQHVLDALRQVPRHKFVPKNLQAFAYDNRPLPIGYGQTISQPYIVAIMTDLLHIGKHHRVLEIGTGSGYQAAILAQVAHEVFSIEIIEALAKQAKSRLTELKYDNVRVRHGDGYYGWQEYAPYDAIIVTAVASHVPPALIEQLKPGGRIVLPLGSRFMTQQLVVVKKAEDGKLTTRQILPVRFVPLTGNH